MCRNPGSSEIRQANIAGAEEIARLTTELGYAATAEDTSCRLSVLLSRPSHFIAVASANDARLLGWIAAERRHTLDAGDAGERWEISGLIVSADARGGGVGQALVSARENWAAGEGLATIMVRSNIARSESHAFYQALAFKREKTQHVCAKALVVG